MLSEVADHLIGGGMSLLSLFVKDWRASRQVPVAQCLGRVEQAEANWQELGCRGASDD